MSYRFCKYSSETCQACQSLLWQIRDDYRCISETASRSSHSVSCICENGQDDSQSTDELQGQSGLERMNCSNRPALGEA